MARAECDAAAADVVLFLQKMQADASADAGTQRDVVAFFSVRIVLRRQIERRPADYFEPAPSRLMQTADIGCYCAMTPPRVMKVHTHSSHADVAATSMFPPQEIYQ